jgi:hypothetical protein
MAFPQYTITYKVEAVGSMPPGVIEAQVSAIPLPISQIEALGVFVVSDTTSVSSTEITREVVVEVSAPSEAVLVAHLLAPGQSGSGIGSVSVTSAGSGYVAAPPCIGMETGQTLAELQTETGKGSRLQAYLKIVGSHATQVEQGSGYSSATVAGLVGGMPLGAATATDPGPDGEDDFLSSEGFGTRLTDPRATKAPFTACVGSLVVTEQGSGYSAGTVILWAEPTAKIAGARKPIAFPVITGGKVTGVVLVDPGSGYVESPLPVIFDPAKTGKGAELQYSMVRGLPAQLTVNLGDLGAITSVSVTDPGDGYVSVPTLVIFDPTGAGSGAVYTVDAVPGSGMTPGTASLLGVSRVDVLNPGAEYHAPAVHAMTLFEAAFEKSISLGDDTYPSKAFNNLIRTAIQNLVPTLVTETVA